MWSKTLTVITALTPRRLFTLMQAADANAPNAFASLSIQLDIGAGGSRLYIGNPASLSATNRGRELIASQWQEWGPFNMNIISPNDIWVMTDAAQVNINVEGWTI